MSVAEKVQHDTPSDATIEVRALAPALGAEVTGVDIAGGLSDTTFQAIRDALHRHSVIVIRDQRMPEPDQIAFTKRLGPLRTSFYNQYAPPGYPELTLISNIVENGRAIGIMDAGALWHSDASYLKTPDMYTGLYGIEIPHRDGKALGDTLFVSTAEAYDQLPEALKQRISGRKAVHSFAHHLEKKAVTGNLKRAPLTPEQRAKTPDVEHPIVRTHPITGRKSLYVTEGHTGWIAGMDRAESDALLTTLWDHIKRPEFTYRHSWRVGDFLIWDNCATQHLANFDYGDIRRRLNRAGVEGTAPA